LKTYDTFEDELDDIRLRIYEEIKDMTPEEEIVYIKMKTAPVMKEFGIRTADLEIVRRPVAEKMPITEQAKQETVSY